MNKNKENWIHPLIKDTKLFCDASGLVWEGLSEIKTTGGAWSETVKDYHVKEKELLDIFYSLKTFKSDLQSKHSKTYSDNTTVVAAIN